MLLSPGLTKMLLLSSQWNGSLPASCASPDVSVMICVLTGIHLLKVTVIHDGDERKCLDYLDVILPKLCTEFGVAIVLDSIPIDYEERFYSYTERFAKEEGKLLPLRRKQEKFSTQIHRQNDWPTADEMRNSFGTHFGVIVVVAKLSHLDNYLRGSARIPFKTPSGQYVINVLEEFDENDEIQYEILEWILERLWGYYGILKAAIAFNCCGKTFYYFNPFERKEPPGRCGMDEREHCNWGRIFRADLSTSTSPMYCGRSLASLYTTFNFYPFRYRHSPFFPNSIGWEQLPRLFLKRPMCSDARNYSKDLGGKEGIIFGNLMQKLQFDPDLRSDDNSNIELGQRKDDFNSNGSLSDVLYGRVALSANKFVILKQNSISVEYLRPIGFSKFCVLTAKAAVRPRSWAYFGCFRFGTWLFILFAQFAAYFCYISIRHYYANRWMIKPLGWILLRDTVRGFTDEGTISPARCERTSQRLLLATMLVYSLTLTGIYDGHISMFYSTTTYFKDLQSLDDVDDSHCTFEQNTLGSVTMIQDLKASSSVIQSISSKIRLTNRTLVDIVRDVADKKEVCLATSENFFKIFDKIFVTDDGLPELHMVTECFINFFASYLIRKDWALAERFNSILARLDAAGLLRYWHEAASSALTSAAEMTRAQIRSGPKPLVLDDFKYAFLLLGVGHFVAFLVLLCERLRRRSAN